MTLLKYTAPSLFFAVMLVWVGGIGLDESGDGLLSSSAFATVTFNDQSTRIGAFSDTIVEFTANVTSDHSGGVTIYDWRLTGNDDDDVTIHQSDSSTLKFEVSDTNSTDVISFVLIARDADGNGNSVYQFYMSPRPMITIAGGDTLRQVSVGDTFAVPSATCAGGKPGAGFTAQSEPDSIDTSVAAQHTITYTCEASSLDYPPVTKTLSVRVGNPGPPGPITVAIESISASVPEGDTISLTGSSTGGNGSPLTYAWSSNPDTAGVFSATDILNPDFTAPAVDRDTRYTLTLTINDDRYTGSRSVNINVINDPTPVVNIHGLNPLEIEYNGNYTAPAVTCTDNDNTIINPDPDPSTITIAACISSCTVQNKSDGHMMNPNTICV